MPRRGTRKPPSLHLDTNHKFSKKTIRGWRWCHLVAHSGTSLTLNISRFSIMFSGGQIVRAGRYDDTYRLDNLKCLCFKKCFVLLSMLSGFMYLSRMRYTASCLQLTAMEHRISLTRKSTRGGKKRALPASTMSPSRLVAN